MSAARVIEINSTSHERIEHAIQDSIARAATTACELRGAWVRNERAQLEGGTAIIWGDAVRRDTVICGSTIIWG